MPSEETVNITPVSYDINKLPPEAPDGAWDFRIKRCKVRSTKPEKGAYPMIEMVVMLDAAHNSENENFVGAELWHYLVFFPEDHKAARTGKQNVQRVLDACGVDRSVVPKQIRKVADLQPLVEALTDCVCPGWTVQQIDKQTGEARAQLYFVEPRGLNLGGLPAVEPPAGVEEPEEELEEEPEPPPPPPPPVHASKKPKK